MYINRHLIFGSDHWKALSTRKSPTMTVDQDEVFSERIEDRKLVIDSAALV
jgi:hypothetical protein